jgi:hypothetical protein
VSDKLPGSALFDDGTDSSFVGAVSRTVLQPDKPKKLDPQAPLGPVPAGVGIGVPPDPRTSTGGGGIASPLTETAYADRTFFTAATIQSSDGIFTLNVSRLNTINFTDANGSPVKFVLKNKT